MDSCGLNRSLVDIREWFDDPSSHRAALALHESGNYRQLLRKDLLWYYKYYEYGLVNVNDWAEGSIFKEPYLAETESDHHDNSSLAWVAANMDRLSRHYPESSWVFVKDREVVLAGADLAELVRHADEQGIKNPLIIRMEKPSPARRTAYITWSASRLI